MDMTTHSTKVAGYFFLASTAAPAFGSALFLMAITLDLMGQDRFLMSSIVFSSSAAFQIVANPLIARLLRSLSNRLETTFVVLTRSLHFALSIYLFTLLMWESGTLETVAALTALLLVGSVDSVLMNKSPAWAQAFFDIDYSKSAAILNLVGRGSLVLSPFMATQLLNGDVALPFFVLLVFAALSAFSPLSLRVIFANNQDNEASIESSSAIRVRNWSPWAKWYISFLLFANFSISSLSFLILTGQRDTSDGALIYTTLYGTFLVVQSLIGFGAISVDRLSNPAVIRCIFVALSLVVVMFGLANSTAAAIYCVIVIGILYSFIAPMLAQSAFGKFPKSHFREYVSTGKAVGRAASLASTWLAGIAVSLGFDVNGLILAIGITGLALSVAIMKLEP